MNLTDYHAKYFAHELTKRCSSDSLEKLAGAVAGAQVDLNPHQVDAALFAFHSPLSKGALIADEVGLGKTIEAGLVISQKWAERKRRVLVVVPSNLRKQWYQELTEKFFLSCQLLETKSYNAAVRQGNFRPFDVKDKVVICSYQFARKQATDVANTPWDLVVIDEAHRLRNVYKPSNVIANTLKQALKNAPMLLLTATPLQNSLLELFGLVSFIDEHAFGDLKSFREQFANLNQGQVFKTLKARLRPICHRTLRRQVTAYVPFTKRHPVLEEFTPEEAEDRLYELVSEYLRRDNLQALPASQRSLMTLVLRKLLASSTFAIAGALESLSKRLKAKIKKEEPPESLEDELDQDYEALDETAEEWSEDEPPETLSDADRAARAIYAAWLKKHAGTDRVTGSKTADIRSALVDYFREEGRIMIATEAGAEGINLQFCSLVVNYDLPWNPQRIKQRIGRCHRYGQKHDVVVVNFLNRKNAADQRVYELPRRSGEAHLYRSSHPLAEAILEQAKRRVLSPAEVRFDYSSHDGKVSLLQPLVGKAGWLTLSLFTVESLDQAEDYLVFATITDSGQRLEAEADKLEGWADDLKLGLEREIKELDRQIREARRTATIALTLEEKLEGQKQIKALEAQRSQRRRSLFDAQDKVDGQREELIAGMEGKLTQRAKLATLFTPRWRLQ